MTEIESLERQRMREGNARHSKTGIARHHRQRGSTTALKLVFPEGTSSATYALTAALAMSPTTRSNGRRKHPRRTCDCDTNHATRQQQLRWKQWSRWLAPFFIIVLSVITSAPLVCANPFSSGRSRTDPPLQRRRTPLLKRKLQSWMIRHQSEAKATKRMGSRLLSGKATVSNLSSGPTGSILTFRWPTKERIFRWFGTDGEDPNQILRCMMARKEYNHNIVGITNPFLHLGNANSQIVSSSPSPTVDGGPDEESEFPLDGIIGDGGSSSQQETGNRKALPVSRVQVAQKYWWPPLQASPNVPHPSNREKRKRTLLPFRKVKEDWRILVYRKRVGRGKDCYQRVRDAALDWEFWTDDGSLGILEVPATSPREGGPIWGQYQSLTRNHKGCTKLPKPYAVPAAGRYSVRPVIETEAPATGGSCVYRSLGSSSRRLVSFASKSMRGLKPQLYAVNPLMVVYDLVDQRAPGTTFTSTAYATLKGHWLRGEERVTVALRDGSEEVDVEILSISRAGPSLWAKSLWPFVGDMQSTFFERHLEHLARVGASDVIESEEMSLGASRVLPRLPVVVCDG
jgi:uncharacterized protein (UPF0548 family)